MTPTRFTAPSAAQTWRFIWEKQVGFASLLLITLFMLFAGRAQAYSQIIAFGDSLSDNGNFFALTGQPGPPYFNGRLSNGPVWVETLAANLGNTLDDRAVAGATTGTVNTNGIGGGITDQFNQYFSEGPADPNALYTVWGGANDFLALGPGDDPIAAVGTAVTNLLTGIGGLISTGAQNIMVVLLPDLGLTPRSLASPDGGAGATVISNVFNLTLLSNLASTFPGFNFNFLDTFSLLQDVVANPGNFGLTNVTQPCFDATVPSVCADPDVYAFWDDIHPTNTLHNELAAQAQLALIPVPAALWLFGSALGMLGWMKRRAA